MNKFEINKKIVGAQDGCFFIAEIGQNHQGNLSIAKQLILEAKMAGVDCVKFQKSNLKEKFTRAALARAYPSKHSWGSTYGDHKAHLEFSITEMAELQAFARNHSILFTASAMDNASLDELVAMDVPFIKIGSGDTSNWILLKEAIAHDIPLIISTGMQSMETIDSVHKLLSTRDDYPFALLHCVSSYPTEAKDTHLRLISCYANRFPNTVIGYSGHEVGIEISIAAHLLGAKIIERHFTLNKDWKGSDHSSSLLPNEFASLIAHVRAIEASTATLNNDKTTANILTVLEKFGVITSDKVLDSLQAALVEVDDHHRRLFSCEVNCYEKLGKSLVYGKSMKQASTLTENDIRIKVAHPKGIDPEHCVEFIGRTLARDVAFDDALTEYDFI